MNKAEKILQIPKGASLGFWRAQKDQMNQLASNLWVPFRYLKSFPASYSILKDSESSWPEP